MLWCKVEDKFNDCKFEYKEKVLKEKSSKYVYYCWMQQYIVIPQA